MGMTKGLNGRRGWMLATLSAALVLAGCGNNHHSASGQGIPVAQTRFLVSTAAYTATLSSAVSASSQTIVYSMPAVTGSGTVTARAVVLVPKGTPPVQGWPMVVWAHGTTGVADGCEPSATSDLAQYDGLVAQLLQRGFMVVAPDYEGLGHSPTSNHPYLNRDSEARSMLYAAMAAREQVAAAGLRWVERIFSITHTDQHFTQLIDALAPQGKLALIDDPELIDVRLLKRKSLSLHWELMFTRSLFQTRDMEAQHHLLNALADMVDRGVIRSTVQAHLGPICAKNLKKAHALLEGGTVVGKIVLEGFN